MLGNSLHPKITHSRFLVDFTTSSAILRKIILTTKKKTSIFFIFPCFLFWISSKIVTELRQLAQRSYDNYSNGVTTDAVTELRQISLRNRQSLWSGKLKHLLPYSSSPCKAIALTSWTYRRLSYYWFCLPGKYKKKMLILAPWPKTYFMILCFIPPKENMIIAQPYKNSPMFIGNLKLLCHFFCNITFHIRLIEKTVCWLWWKHSQNLARWWDRLVFRQTHRFRFSVRCMLKAMPDSVYDGFYNVLNIWKQSIQKF